MFHSKHPGMLLQITVEVGGADFMLVPRSVGYIKQTGDGLAGPPVIVYNHRRVLPGRMGALLKAQQVAWVECSMYLGVVYYL